MIEAHAFEGRIKLWREVRTGRGAGKELRWHLTLLDFSYLVVLADRAEFLLPWTAYPVEHSHERRKLEKRWATYRVAP